VANDKNWPQTAAIKVCLPYNFAVALILSISVSVPVKKNE
jgi:hypothetical protein